MNKIWQPSEKDITKTHISQWMKKLGFSSYLELHRWSVENYPQFWSQSIEALQIPFKKKYQSIVDLSKGVESPQWLFGADMNIADSCFLAEPNKTAILYQDYQSKDLKKLSYEELNKKSNQVANALLKIGVKKGDAIAIDMPMTIEAVIAYLGIVKMGAAVVSIADSFTANEVALRLKISKAKAAFTQDLIPRAGKMIPMYSKLVEAAAEKIIVVPHQAQMQVELRSQDLSWQDFIANSSDQFTSVGCHPEDTTNILFSSGTTGDPKAIPWTHTTPIKAAVDAYFHHDMQETDVLAWPTSIGWMMGPWLIYAALVNKATMALSYEPPLNRQFGEFIEKAKVTVFGVVPSMVKTWRQSHCMEGLDWSSIKAFSSTGECSGPEDYIYLSQLGKNKPIIEYCGGTEIGGGYLTSTLVQDNYASNFTTAALGLDFVVLDEELKECSEGEVFLVPPSIGLSNNLLNHDHHKVYYKDTPTVNGKKLRRHGDRVLKISAHQFAIMGRADDTMNLGGVKVSSAEIERTLNVLPQVHETAAIAIQPKGGGPDHLVIYAVAPGQQAQDLVKSFHQEIKTHLNPLFKVHDVVVIEKLPRTASNKILRRELRDLYKKSMETL